MIINKSFQSSLISLWNCQFEDDNFPFLLLAFSCLLSLCMFFKSNRLYQTNFFNKAFKSMVYFSLQDNLFCYVPVPHQNNIFIFWLCLVLNHDFFFSLLSSHLLSLIVLTLHAALCSKLISTICKVNLHSTTFPWDVSYIVIVLPYLITFFFL